MYDKEQILAFNNDKASYDAVWAIVKHFRTQQIGFERFLVLNDEDKCAIHIPVFLEDTGYGCGEISVGNHPSIKSLYDNSRVTYCHVELGARVIDTEFAKKVAALDDEFVASALAFGAKFQKRYLSGAFADWRCYGRGYCYLQLIHPNARHRVARILGPFPLVSDVFRFVIVVGNWGGVGFFIQRLPGDIYHVISRDWSPGTSLRSVLKYSIGMPFSGRVGGVVSSYFRDGLVGYADIFHASGYSLGLPDAAGVQAFIASMPSERADAIMQWMVEHRVVRTDDTIAGLMLATSALLALNVTGANAIKSKVRLWQVFGDIVCKQYVAMHVLAGGGTVEDYSHLTGKNYQSNKSMSQSIVRSDLFEACSAPGLAADSKAWADILEGVIGVIAMTQSSAVLKHCLIHFNLVPKECALSEPVVIDKIGKLDFNSGDWKTAAELLVKSKI